MPYAIIEDNKVVNIVVDVDAAELAENPAKYVNYSNGWTYPAGIDGGVFFPAPTPEEI